MNSDNSDGWAEPDVELRRLSALVDGEVDAVDLDAGCLNWCTSAGSRAAWHAYHLIGDVMRSDQLASVAVRDEAFLRAFRVRLDVEPVVLAPLPAAPNGPGLDGWRRRRAWFAPVVVAAGFASVAGVLWVSRVAAPPPTGAQLSMAGLAASSVDGGRPGATAAALRVDQQLIRDARLDRYFEAHRDAFAGNALGVPGGALRSVDTLLPQR